MTLLMRDQENLEKGIEEGLKVGREIGREIGREQGRERGIRCTILICRDLGLQDEVILKQLQEKFSLKKVDAERYM